jgi:hypothetical protein
LPLETAKLHSSSLVVCQGNSNSKGSEFKQQVVEKLYGIGRSFSFCSPLAVNPQAHQYLVKFTTVQQAVAILYAHRFLISFNLVVILVAYCLVSIFELLAETQFTCTLQSSRKDLPDGIQHVCKYQVEIIYLMQNTSSAKLCLAASTVLSILFEY